MNLRGKWDHVGLGEITITQLLFHIFVHSKLWHQEEICAHLDYIFKWFICLFVYKSCILAWAENFLKYINKSLFTVRDSQWIFFFFLTNSNPRGFPVFMRCEAFFFFLGNIEQKWFPWVSRKSSRMEWNPGCFVACYRIWLVSAGCGTRRLNRRVTLSAHHSICISCLTCGHEFLGSDRKNAAADVISWNEFSLVGACFQTRNSGASDGRHLCAPPGRIRIRIFSSSSQKVLGSDGFGNTHRWRRSMMLMLSHWNM